MEVYYVAWQIFIALFLLIMMYALLINIDKRKKRYNHESDQPIEGANDVNENA
jgi:ACR3 family arsenite efflux pump ArsB